MGTTLLRVVKKGGKVLKNVRLEGGMREGETFAWMVGCMWKEQRVPEGGNDLEDREEIKGKKDGHTD